MRGVRKYKLKNGEVRYMFKAYLGTSPVTGKRVETTRRGFRKARDAKQAMEKLKLDFKAGKYHSETGNHTFDELFEAWFESYKHTVRDTTADDRKKCYDRYIRKRIGNIQITRMTVPYMQRLVNDLAKRYRAYKLMLAPLRGVYKYAIRLGIVEKNVMRLVIYPRPIESKQTKKFYTKEELTAFLKCCKKEKNPLIFIFFRLAAYTGMRHGELLGLRWSDFNFMKKEVSVSRTAVLKRGEKSETHKPKTRNSIRTISLDDETLQYLQSYLTEYRPSLSNYVFTNPYGEQYTFAISCYWNDRICKKNGLPKITIHGFRHTHASLLFEAGASIKEVQDRLGHADSKTTLDIYTHVTKATTNETGAKFAKYMES